MNPSQTPDLNAMLQSPQAAALMKNKEAVQKMAQSQDAQALLQMLDSGHGLQKAADQASQGDPKALFSLMQQVMKSPEGAQLMERIHKNIPR